MAKVLGPIHAPKRWAVWCGILMLLCADCKPDRHARADEPDPEAVEKAVARAVVYLKNAGPRETAGRATIAGLALLKAEVPPDDPQVLKILEKITAKVKNGVYTPANSHEHGYEAGLDAITLEAADREKYKPEIEAIAQYLIRVQNRGGDWNYPNELVGGDTSITQYGLLGLWAAARAGVRVPTETWDRAANWLVTTQDGSGGFKYHPLGGDGQIRVGMSAAGTASLYLCRMHLYPKADGRTIKLPEERAASRPARRFGVLERIDNRDPAKPAGGGGPKEPKSTSYTPRTGLERIDTGIEHGMKWMAENFTILNANHFRYYYLYTLERLSALADAPRIGDHDWYAEGAEFLLSKQGADGNWTENSGIADTAFAVMFLVRATNKMLDRKSLPRKIGSGLLAGGRGLPDNLAAVQVADGKVGVRKAQGALDELLAELETQKTQPVAAVQKAIVEAVQLGDRESLIAQTERLRTLAKHPNADVRRTALWALGRGRDLSLATLLIAALDDSDVDVVVEANSALCYLSRKPDGVGVAANPLNGLGEEATVAQKTAALNAWRTEAVKRWKAWYLTVRPYEERNDLNEPRAGGKT